MAIKNFVSPHVHIASLDSASTPQAFVNKELELDTGHIVVTDHGSLEAARDVYDLAHKNGLKPIVGIESYLRDDDDPILQANGIPKNEDGTYEDYAVYSHCTMHVQDFTAFSEMSKILSKRYRTAEKHGAEYKPIFTWDDMQHLGQYNVTACSSCLIGICGRHLVKHGNQKIAEEYYCKMASIVKPGNFYVEVFPHNCDSFYKEAVILEFEDGSRVELRQYNKIATDNHAATERSGGIRADAFARQFEHLDGLVGGKDSIRAYMQNKKWVECPALKIVRATAVAQIMKNECRTWGDGDSKIEVNDGDVQRGVNEFVIRMANKYGHKIILSDDSHFSSKDEHEAQTIKLTASGGGWRMANSHHRLSSQDAWMYFHNRMGISERQFEEWVDNGYEWASKFENFTMPSKPQLPTKFYPSDTLGHLYSLIDKHGRMKDKPEYRNRLEREIELFHRNGTVDLLPYFFVCEEVIDEHVKHNKLPGSGRGSSAGVLISYLLGITHVNPLKYNLSLDRFLTLDRIQTGKYPDIDMDLPDADVIMPKDNPESGYLPQRFGDHFCQISTNSKMHLKQSIKDVFRSRLGKVPQNIELICKHLPATPQGVDDADFVFGYEDNDGNLVAGALETNPTLKEFAEKYPDEWTSVTRLLGLTRQKSRHASGYIIANQPIEEIVPTMPIGGVRCTQYTAPAVEASGLIKFDFLKLNSAKDLGLALKNIHEQRPEIDWTQDFYVDGEKVPGFMAVPHKDKFYSIYDLPNEPEVYNRLVDGDTSSVFQLDTYSALLGLAEFNHYIGQNQSGQQVKAINSIEGLSAFTALDRPGPLDAYVSDGRGGEHNMLVEYSLRARGMGGADRIAYLDKLLEQDYGVIVFQETLTQVFKELSGCSGIEAENFRGHISKKQMKKVSQDKEIFMPKAIEKLGPETAEKIWEMMITFGKYGFCKAHAYSYMINSYATAFLRHYFPLEWWSAVLQNAERDDITQKFWPHCNQYVSLPSIKHCDSKFTIRDGKIYCPLWVIAGVGEKAQEQLAKYAPYDSLDDFCKKMLFSKENGGRNQVNAGTINALIVSGVMDELFPETTVELDGVIHKLTPSLDEKVLAYEAAVRRAAGKKEPKNVKSKSKILNLSPLEMYQYQKKAIPMKSIDLRPLVWCATEVTPEQIFESRNDMLYRKRTDGDGLQLVESGNSIEFCDRGICSTGTHTAVGFVLSHSIFQFGPNKTKEAAKFLIDIDGYRFEKVKWPDNQGKLGSHYKQDLEGAICVFIFKSHEGKELELRSLAVLQSPTSLKKDTSDE